MTTTSAYTLLVNILALQGAIGHYLAPTYYARPFVVGGQGTSGGAGQNGGGQIIIQTGQANSYATSGTIRTGIITSGGQGNIQTGGSQVVIGAQKPRISNCRVCRICCQATYSQNTQSQIFVNGGSNGQQPCCPCNSVNCQQINQNGGQGNYPNGGFVISNVQPTLAPPAVVIPGPQPPSPCNNNVIVPSPSPCNPIPQPVPPPRPDSYQIQVQPVPTPVVTVAPPPQPSVQPVKCCYVHIQAVKATVSCGTATQTCCHSTGTCSNTRNTTIDLPTGIFGLPTTPIPCDVAVQRGLISQSDLNGVCTTYIPVGPTPQPNGPVVDGGNGGSVDIVFPPAPSPVINEYVEPITQSPVVVTPYPDLLTTAPFVQPYVRPDVPSASTSNNNNNNNNSTTSTSTLSAFVALIVSFILFC